MENRTDLVQASLRLLTEGQTASGAFLACANFPNYQYCWFRDGTFVAHALDLWGQHDAARRFYEWGVQVVLGNATIVRLALSMPPHQPPAEYLHTRYRLDGSAGSDDWPNFQLDGFGTFLWGLDEHLTLSGTAQAPDDWLSAVSLLSAYLGHLWAAPNYDCWEEFPDKVHTSTLCALWAGLVAASRRLGCTEALSDAGDVRAVILTALEAGALPKFKGSNAVDASLLWACAPYGVLAPNNPLMAHTIDRVEHELTGSHGGVHRYSWDTYYGGGAWVLLTASLAECRLGQGRIGFASDLRQWIEYRVDSHGYLPEQVSIDLNDAKMLDTWIEKWGPIATPLLWSHASYLRLVHRLNAVQHPDRVAS